MNTPKGPSAATHPGRAHVGPRRNDSLTYKAKVYAPFVSLLILAITFTWFFTRYDKRITVLEISDAAQDAQVKANTSALGGIDAWMPNVDFKLALLLDHFGIRIPDAPVK